MSILEESASCAETLVVSAALQEASIIGTCVPSQHVWDGPRTALFRSIFCAFNVLNSGRSNATSRVSAVDASNEDFPGAIHES